MALHDLATAAEITRLEKALDAANLDRQRLADELFDCRNKYGCGPTQEGPDALQRAEGYREQIVWGFYEDEYPSYCQGSAGEHELTDPITADEANGLVKQILELRAYIAAQYDEANG
jgi:hypothetical protein